MSAVSAIAQYYIKLFKSQQQPCLIFDSLLRLKTVVTQSLSVSSMGWMNARMKVIRVLVNLRDVQAQPSLAVHMAALRRRLRAEEFREQANCDITTVIKFKVDRLVQTGRLNSEKKESLRNTLISKANSTFLCVSHILNEFENMPKTSQGEYRYKWLHLIDTQAPLLLERGVNADIAGTGGRTALHKALRGTATIEAAAFGI